MKTSELEFKVELSFPFKNLEHELFRACMNVVMGIRQGNPDTLLQQQADALEACAVKYISSEMFTSSSNVKLVTCRK